MVEFDADLVSFGGLLAQVAIHRTQMHVDFGHNLLICCC